VNASLQKLLQIAIDRRKAKGERASYEVLSQEVLAAAEESGVDMTINRTTISRIMRGNYIGVTPRVLRAVAYIADVDESIAFIAAGQRPPGEPFASELPEGVDSLRPRERRAAIEVLKALVAQRQEIDAYERKFGPLHGDASARLAELAQPRASGKASENEEAASTSELQVSGDLAAAFSDFADGLDRNVGLDETRESN